MKSNSILATILLIICALCFIQTAYYYPLLPERVPSHFGTAGRPDTWSTKNFFVISYLVVVAVSSVFFLCLSLGLSRMPGSLINLPHKEFWLAPEQKEKTLTFLSQYFLRFASATALLLFAVFNQSMHVALGKAQAFSHPLVSLVIYLVLILVWTVQVVIKFGNPHH